MESNSFIIFLYFRLKLSAASWSKVSICADGFLKFKIKFSMSLISFEGIFPIFSFINRFNSFKDKRDWYLFDPSGFVLEGRMEGVGGKYENDYAIKYTLNNSGQIVEQKEYLSDILLATQLYGQEICGEKKSL